MLKTIVLMIFVCSLMACNGSDNSGYQFSNEADMVEYGRKVYLTQCVLCHGVKGNAKIAQAADLTQTKMNETQIGDLIYHGGKNMPRFNDKLGEPEINAIAKYVLTLKQQ